MDEILKDGIKIRETATENIAQVPSEGPCHSSWVALFLIVFSDLLGRTNGIHSRVFPTRSRAQPAEPWTAGGNT